MNKDLPDGWKWVKLGDIAFEVSDRIDNPSKSGLERFVGLEHLDSESLTVKRWGNTEDVTSAMKLFKKGDMLFARRNAYLKRASMATFDGVCSGDAIVLRQKNKKYVDRLLPLILNTEKLWEFAIANASGSMSKRVKWRDLAMFEIPLPPKEEQRRIVDMLWAAEDYIVKNERLVDEAEFYKKILMTELFTRGIGHKKFKDNEVGRIPEEWEVVRLEELTEIITKGTTPTTYGYNFTELGINFIKIESIDESENFIFKNIAHISEEANNAISRSKLKENDILFSIAGALGRVVVVTKEILPANTNQAIAIIRLKRDCKLAVEYLRYYLISPLIQNYITTIAVQTAQANLSLTQVSNFLICIPPLPEQRRITEILSKVEDTIKKARESIKKTRALKTILINQFLKIGLGEIAFSDTQQDQRIIYETQVSE